MVAQNVTVIPARRFVGSRKTTEPVKKLRVAAYCRVSTDNEEQESSYEVQVEHYTEYISRNPEWELAGIYADDGISGTNTKKRDNFNRLMDDCRAGKIDKILVKSISRFARNTLDCLKFTRELKDLNISVYFEKENIDTLDAKGEVLLTIMASLAQQESESLSMNVKLGIQYRNQQGKVQVNHNRFLGYTKDDDGKLVIVPEEAEIVRRIYAEYLEGKSLLAIRRGLEADGIRNGAGNLRWHESNIQQILINEKYIGDALLQKTYTVNTLEKKREINNGRLPKYYVEGSHEPIIDKVVYLKVQAVMAERASLYSGGRKRAYSGKYALSGIVFCSNCGDVYRRIRWNNQGCKLTVWRCVGRIEKGSTYCPARTISEDELQTAVVNAVNKLFSCKNRVIPVLMENIRSVIDGGTDEKIAEIDRLIREKQTELLADERDAVKAEEIGNRIIELRKEKQQILTDGALDQDKIERLEDMKNFLDGQNDFLTEYSDALTRRLVEKITVYDEKIMVLFKSGQEIELKA